MRKNQIERATATAAATVTAAAARLHPYSRRILGARAIQRTEQ